jgi:hypothetical protein
MAHYAEQQVRSLITRVEDGHSGAPDALTALQSVLDMNAEVTDPEGTIYALIGGIEPLEGHKPAIPMTSTDEKGNIIGWHPSLTEADGGAERMTLVSLLAELAAWSVLGNRNIPMEHKELPSGKRPLQPTEYRYNRGTHGHNSNPSTPDGYILTGHTHVLQAIEARAKEDPTEIVGVVDIVTVNRHDLGAVSPDDPGHYAVRHSIKSEQRYMPVRTSDLLRLQALGKVASFFYQPPKA